MHRYEPTSGFDAARRFIEGAALRKRLADLVARELLGDLVAVEPFAGRSSDIRMALEMSSANRPAESYRRLVLGCRFCRAFVPEAVQIYWTFLRVSYSLKCYAAQQKGMLSCNHPDCLRMARS